MSKHKVFISYHHANDQAYKEALLGLNDAYDIFIDASVDTDDIDENLNDQTIRAKIRDEYLRDSTVTLLLVGLETKRRKHVDWEVYSSMFNGTVNKQSGVLVVMLPSTGCTYFTAAHGEEEKALIYPENASWTYVNTRAAYEQLYPYASDRIIDNLLKPEAKVSVTTWDRISGNITNLRFLINATFDDRLACDYNLRRPMRRSNS